MRSTPGSVELQPERWQEKLHIIGQKRQVICITHLPQIAAAADAHYLIQKQTDQTTTKTGNFSVG